MAEPQKTEYIVLRWNPDGYWYGSFTTTAANPEAAIRSSLESLGEAEVPPERCVAVPTRSWKPMDIVHEVKRTVKLTPVPGTEDAGEDESQAAFEEAS